VRAGGAREARVAGIVDRLEAAGSGTRLRKRRWGYLVWLIAAGVIGVPEIIAAAWSHWLPFTTISTMTGHLERRHNWVELIVVALIVLVVFALARVRPSYRVRGAAETSNEASASGHFRRTPGGRLSTLERDKERKPGSYDDELAPALFTVCAIVSLAGIGVGTWAATRWWDDARHFQPAYVLYGSLGLLWLVLPSLAAFLFKRDVPFPTMFRTIGNLEEWLETRHWPWSLGPKLAWLIAYVIFAGLAILLLHLTLYPYPDITKILNPNG
jgi:hypothetical protein